MKEGDDAEQYEAPDEDFEAIVAALLKVDPEETTGQTGPEADPDEKDEKDSSS